MHQLGLSSPSLGAVLMLCSLVFARDNKVLGSSTMNGIPTLGRPIIAIP